jgi:hypothetical protein
MLSSHVIITRTLPDRTYSPRRTRLARPRQLLSSPARARFWRSTTTRSTAVSSPLICGKPVGLSSAARICRLLRTTRSGATLTGYFSGKLLFRCNFTGQSSLKIPVWTSVGTTATERVAGRGHSRCGLKSRKLCLLARCTQSTRPPGDESGWLRPIASTFT